jgi:hypothetical protein
MSGPDASYPEQSPAPPSCPPEDVRQVGDLALLVLRRQLAVGDGLDGMLGSIF